MSEPLLNPREKYLRDVAGGDFKPDEAQAAAVEELQRIWEALVGRYEAAMTKRGLVARRRWPSDVVPQLRQEPDEPAPETIE